MPRLAPARDDQLDAIYKESHALWGAGLSLEDYRALWEDLRRTPWGSEHAGFLVWLDASDRVLSSLKTYRPRLRLLDRIVRSTVLGAVFTPQHYRGQGHAADMVCAVVEQARERGDGAALLFSDIGTEYYGALGFQALPAQEQWGSLDRAAGAAPAGWSLRPMEDADLDSVRLAHQAFCEQRPIAVIRDTEHWRFLRVRSQSFFDRLKDPQLRQCCGVALRDKRFAGYLITVEGHGEWSVREVGAVGGDFRAMAQIVRAGGARARTAGLRRFYSWLPCEVVRELSDLRLRNRPRRRAVPMVRSLDPSLDLAALGSPEAAYLPFQDQF